jgi:Phosphoesterase family
MKNVSYSLSWLSGVVMACLLATTTLAACVGVSSSTTTTTDETGIQKIQHVVVIMQENRSFDSYFGTHPGADGIPIARLCHHMASDEQPESASRSEDPAFVRGSVGNGHPGSACHVVQDSWRRRRCPHGNPDHARAASRSGPRPSRTGEPGVEANSSLIGQRIKKLPSYPCI